jgi:hypothetical protein
MSIFGLDSPKFQSNLGTLEFDNSVLDYAHIVPKTIEHSSVVNSDRNYLNNRFNSAFRIIVNLYKYADPKSKFNEIMSFKGQWGWFFPHKDEDRAARTFHIVRMIPFYIGQTIFFNRILIDIESRQYTKVLGESGYGDKYGGAYGKHGW